MNPTDLSHVLFGTLQGLLLILLAPGAMGLLRYLEARIEKRRRPFVTVLQPYLDLVKLMGKPSVRSTATSWVFAAAPVGLFAVYASLAFLFPVFNRLTLFTTRTAEQSPVMNLDLIQVVYVLAAARFLLSLVGLDSDAPFGGLGGSREMFIQFLTEIGFILVLTALAADWNTVTLAKLFLNHWQQRVSDFLQHSELIILAVSLLIVIVYELELNPINNRRTELELTMTGAGVRLEYGGRDKAFLEWAEMIKLAFMLTLFINLFFPLPLLYPASSDALLANLLAFLAYLLKMVLLLVLVAWWEQRQPKLRLRETAGPVLISIALSLSAIVYIIANLA